MKTRGLGTIDLLSGLDVYRVPNFAFFATCGPFSECLGFPGKEVLVERILTGIKPRK